MKDVDAQFDSSKVSVMIEEGVYPAHAKWNRITEDKATKVGIADIFGLKYKIAQEADKMVQKCYERGDNGNFRIENGKRIPVIVDGKHLEISCEQFVGRELYSNGLFLYKGAEGSGRNKQYTEFLDAIGVELEEIEIDGHKVKQLMAIEESDVTGKAVFVRVAYKENTKTKTFYPTVVDVLKWEGGTNLSEDEMADDLPF